MRVFELLGRLVESDLGFFVGLNGGASALLDTDPATSGLRVKLNAAHYGYEAMLVPASNDDLIFARESVRREDRPYAMVPSRGARETRLHELADLAEGSVATKVVELLRGCRVYHFHDTSRQAPVKQLVPTADNLTLRNDAGNLAAVLLVLAESDDKAERAAYQRIVGSRRSWSWTSRNWACTRTPSSSWPGC